jgi:hypothetical protein
MKRHVTCFVEKVGFEPSTLGTKAERHDHCATRPVAGPGKPAARAAAIRRAAESSCRYGRHGAYDGFEAEPATLGVVRFPASGASWVHRRRPAARQARGAASAPAPGRGPAEKAIRVLMRPSLLVWAHAPARTGVLLGRAASAGPRPAELDVESGDLRTLVRCRTAGSLP